MERGVPLKIPKQITIKGETWKIRFKRLLINDGIECFGLCETDGRVIYLKKDLDPAMLEWTFIHEVLHAILWELHAFLPEDIEEMLVDGTSKCLLDSFHIEPKRRSNAKRR